MKAHILGARDRWNRPQRILGRDVKFPGELKGDWLMKKSGLSVRDARQAMTICRQSFRADDVAKVLRSQYDGRLVAKAHRDDGEGKLLARRFEKGK